MTTPIPAHKTAEADQLASKKIYEVNSDQKRQLFHEVPRAIYQDDPNWVPPLDAEIDAIFDPCQNPKFENGEAQRWILVNEHEAPIGRIAAFIDYNQAGIYEQPTGGIGFFECSNDHEAASLLFDRSRDWLAERGMQAMDGPVNFGSNYNYWGLLEEGFREPSIGMNYHKPYYQKLFGQYGFEKLYEQYTNTLDLTSPLPERFSKIAKRASEHYQVKLQSFNFKVEDQFIKDFTHIYNKAWEFHRDFSRFSEEYVWSLFNSLKDLIEPRFIWFAYVDGEPVAFIMAIPDFNPLLKKFNGKVSGIKKLQFYYFKKTKQIKRARALVMGVVPEYQKKGLEALMIEQLMEQRHHFPKLKEAELSWVGSFNTQMMKIHKATGAQFKHKHVTYRKVFG